jgi:hypothetical protein
LETREEGQVDQIEPGQIVENKETGEIGVTVPDFMSCCTDDETPVVWHEKDGFIGTPTAELRVVRNENPIADPTACGAGLGADCCIFLTAGRSGFHCERHTSMRYQLLFKKTEMTAQREPEEPYPFCKKFGTRLCT